MRKTNYLVVIALFTALILSGFQCSSTELTSAKLYIQQKNCTNKIINFCGISIKSPCGNAGAFNYTACLLFLVFILNKA